MPMQISVGGNYSVIGHEAITVSTAAIGPSLTTAFPGGVGVADAYYAYFTVETNPVRFWLDGASNASPTASVGHLLPAGSILEVHGNVNIKNIQFISQNGSSATVFASYGR